MSFRVGTKVPRHVYEGDTPLFTAASEEEAARLVGLLNVGEDAPRLAETLRNLLRHACWEGEREHCIVQQHIQARTVLAAYDAREPK